MRTNSMTTSWMVDTDTKNVWEDVDEWKVDACWEDAAVWEAAWAASTNADRVWEDAANDSMISKEVGK